MKNVEHLCIHSNALRVPVTLRNALSEALRIIRGIIIIIFDFFPIWSTCHCNQIINYIRSFFKQCANWCAIKTLPRWWVVTIDLKNVDVGMRLREPITSLFWDNITYKGTCKSCIQSDLAMKSNESKQSSVILFWVTLGIMLRLDFSKTSKLL